MIKTYSFTIDGKNEISKLKMGKDWPVVYLLNDNKEIYVGETSNVTNRMTQHLNNKDKSKLEKISIILDEKFNKSAALDIEQQLIQLFAADNKFSLLNLNSGQSSKHNYYQREMYLNKVEEIWLALQKRDLAIKSYQTLKNTDLFKYSPYATLTDEQHEVTLSVVNDIVDKLKNNQTGVSIINGGAGTGKTVLAINMIFTLLNCMNFNVDIIEDEEFSTLEHKTTSKLRNYLSEYGDLKIAFVIPMSSLRETLGKVFSLTKKGLKKEMVISPFDVVKKEYDILFVDETHRLSRRKNITNYGDFDKVCNKLKMDKEEVTQLDWIVNSSKYQILFYDENQTIKGSDLTIDQFNKALDSSNISQYELLSQLRCQGGQYYTSYVNDLLNCSSVNKETIDNYDFKLFENIDDMITSIKECDKLFGLSRNVAGYSWKWISSKCKNLEEVKEKGLEDITIEGKKFIWNMSNKEWILRNTAIDEIGCIHTTQGYDLNYVGVIFGREIDYDPKSNSINIDLDLFFDGNVKKATDYTTVKKYIINSYKVMMMRGIKGCYVYCYNKNLREYFKKFI